MQTELAQRIVQASAARAGLPAGFTSVDGYRLQYGGREYLDFHSAQGSLNYGHCNPALMARLEADTACLATAGARQQRQACAHAFFDVLDDALLAPRDWRLRMQLAGPDAGHALELALRHARRVTGRRGAIAFTPHLHGRAAARADALAQASLRRAAGPAGVSGVHFMPYDQCLGPDIDTLALVEHKLAQLHEQGCLPAAMVVETILGHSGVGVLSWRWLRALSALCRRNGILLIMDESGVGCGRSGQFFSFEGAGVRPDIIVLSRALSGLGLPLAILLSDPALLLPRRDQAAPGWQASMDAGLALLGARHALELFWRDARLARQVRRREALLRDWLENVVHSYPDHGLGVRGRGMVQALDMAACPRLARRLAVQAREKGLLLYLAGERDHIVKIMPALTLPDDQLIRGLEILETCLARVLRHAA